MSYEEKKFEMSEVSNARKNRCQAEMNFVVRNQFLLLYGRLEQAKSILTEYFTDFTFTVPSLDEPLGDLWNLGGISKQCASPIKIGAQPDNVYACH